jgi:peptidoglycan/LPS O-acetylase OafA/YrhL
LTDADSKNPSPPKEKNELKALHGLRFFAAFCILISHASSWLTNFRNGGSSIALINAFGQFFAPFGMPLFFVLSGFVIHYNYSHLFSRRPFKIALQEFFVARIARLVPLFLCFFAIGFLVDGVIDWYISRKVNLFLLLFHRFTLTQSWVYITIFSDRLVLDEAYGLSWSISTEMFFYFVFPAFAVSLFMVRSSSRLLVIGTVWVTAVFAVLTLFWLNRSGLQWFFHQKMGDIFTGWEHSADRWFFYYSPYIRIFEFVLGCIAAQIFLVIQSKPISNWENKLGQVVLAVGCISLLVLTSQNFIRPVDVFSNYTDFVKLNFGCALPLACIIFCVARYDSIATKLMSGTVIVFLGEISYSIYTVHTYTIRIFSRPQADVTSLSGIEAVLRIVAAIALTILLSTATYRFIEQPSRKKIRSYFKAPADTAELGGNQSSQNLYTVFLLFVLAVFVLYQFYIVPFFAPYTR